MNKKTGKRSVVTSDKYLSESGLQGGKILGDHITLASFIIGIPFLIIGLIAMIGIIFDLGFPNNAAIIIAVLLITVIGLLLVIGGYAMYKTKKGNK